MNYRVQSALVIILHGQPKILCAWFLKDTQYWDHSRGEWAKKQTQAHLTVCSRVPDHIQQLWTLKRPQQG